MSWLVYRLSHSALLLGVVSFAAQFPNFFLSPFAGVLADRTNRHRLILITQSLLLLQASAFAVLSYTNKIMIWHIIALDVFFGLVTAVDIPTRQSFIVEIVEKKENLPNAIALNATMVNVTRLIGPTVAGLLIAAAGESVCFLWNAVSFIAVITALLLMRVVPLKTQRIPKNVFSELKAGLSYAYGFPPIRVILTLLGIVSLMGMPYSVLMPMFVTNVFHRGPDMLGFLTASSGAGALAGSIYLIFRRNILGMSRIMGLSAAVFGAGLIGFSFSRSAYLSFVLLFASGFGVMVMMASANTLLQTITEDDKRGRIMSFYVMSLLGVAPIGSLAAGLIATHVGAPTTVLMGGLACLGASAYFFRQLPLYRKWLRPLYVKMGILPAEQPGVPAVTPEVEK